MTQNPVVKIPPERLDQLKAIAAALNLSIADTVGHLIRSEVERGTIRDYLPGITIKGAEGTVEIGFNDERPVVFASAHARILATAIQVAVSPEGSGVINMDLDFLAVRAGNGVRVGLSVGAGPEKTLSRDVARDFARLIEAAASA